MIQRDSENDMIVYDAKQDPELLSQRSRVPPFLRKRATLVGALVFLAVLNVLQYIDSSSTRVRDRLESNSFQGDRTYGPGPETKSSIRNVPGKAIVLASYSKQNLEWTKQIPDGWHAYRYVLDDPSPSVPGSPTTRATATLEESIHNYTYTVPRNQGGEAMAYLSYIIDNYAHLPLFTVFLHGHDRSWHQTEHAADKLRALNLSAVATAGYANMRCAEKPNCLPEKVLDLSHGPGGIKYIPHKLLPSFWRLIFPNGPDPPARLAAVAAAQMAVTRAAILARPLSFWKSLRRPLERDLKEIEKLLPELVPAGHDTFMQGGENYAIGLMYERLWPVLFGAPAEFCPGEDYCFNTVFSGAITCDRYIGEERESGGWEDIECHVKKENMFKAKAAQDVAVKAARTG